MKDKKYIAIVQCHLVKQRCSGYFCEKAFHERSGGFADYAKDQDFRTISLTCGGCCGKVAHRKLNNLIGNLRKREKIQKEQVVVHLSSCITKDNFHGPPCPHLDYLKTLIAKLNVDLRQDTAISKAAENRRKKGDYS